MSQQTPEQKRLTEILDFIANAPDDESIIEMDCNDQCEQIASLAEQVANGMDLSEALPKLERYMQYWGDCREEFYALVAVLREENLADSTDA